MQAHKIIWSKQAKEAVKTIYHYYQKKSSQGAKNVKADLLKAPKTIHFARQYQIDEINPRPSLLSGEKLWDCGDWVKSRR